jgi:hypothetical protein
MLNPSLSSKPRVTGLLSSPDGTSSRSRCKRLDDGLSRSKLWKRKAQSANGSARDKSVKGGISRDLLAMLGEGAQVIDCWAVEGQVKLDFSTPVDDWVLKLG